MKTLLVCLLSGILTFSACGQKSPIKFGDVSTADLKMTVYEKDSSAAAVILADYGESQLVYNQNTGFSLIFERITRIKILTKDGFEWADFSIPLYHTGGDNEKISGLKAVTYNLENGKVIESKVKSESILKEKSTENLDIMKVTWPNVKEGSVLEITYKVNSDFFFNFQDWEFQYTIPAAWSEYRVRIPDFFHYDKYMQGYVSLAINENNSTPSFLTITSKERSGGSFGTTGGTTFTTDKIDFMENRNRWVAQDVPAFKPEPFITTSKDYVSKINFELSYIKYPNQPVQPVMGSWDEINKTYAESNDFGGQVNGNGFLKKIVEEITAGMESDEQKISAINNYVKRNISWDGVTRKFTEKPLRKVLDDKKGNSAEINLLLASMLEKAGFTVFPVLISTRDHGFLRETTPISSQFNNVICVVELADKKILLDGTDAYLPTGVLPERCLNGKGFVVAKSGYRWETLVSPLRSRTLVNADVKLTPEGEMKGNIKSDQTGYYAQRIRKKFFAKGEEDYVKDFISGRSWQINKSEFANTKEIAEPFKETHEITVNDHAVVSGEIIYLNPFLLLREEQNPFKLEKREYPVDFGSPLEKTYICKLMIPEGYSVDEMPQSKVFALPNSTAKYFYNIVQMGNSITLTSSFQINRNIFTQEEYPGLREFYNQVVAKQAEQIVLKKK